MEKHTSLKWVALLLVALAVPGLAWAQGKTASTFQIKGLLLDSLTREGEPYATIRVVKKEQPDKPVKMLVTGADGKFREKVPGTGRFVMTITSVGRTPVVRDFSVRAGEKLVDFGTLYITDAANELEQVVVVAQKPLVKADIDKIEYNVKDDPDSETNSVLEMLRKVPMVTVDGEDNIKVNGSSSFKVYVNGKPNNMMSNNPTDVLKSMPANTIKNIEVITNPGAKYDAEGVGGILNIVTVGGGFEGYTVTFSGNGSNTGAGGGLFGTVQSGKLTVSARYNYSYSSFPESYSGGNRRTVGTAVSGSSSDLDYDGSSKGNNHFQSGSIEASYEIDTLRLLSFSFGLWGGRSRNNGDSHMRAFTPGTPEDMLYSYNTASRSKSSWYSIDGGVDYQRLFSVKDRMLTLSYKVSTEPETSDAYSDYNDTEAAPDWQDFIRRMVDQRNEGDQNTTEHTFQADFTTPFGKLHSIETGVKYILRNNSSNNDRYNRPLSTSDYEFDEDYSSHYRHRNGIFAAYAGYALKLKKLSGRVGVRYENTLQDVEFLLGRGTDFRKHFNDVVPSASLGWKLTDFSNLRLGYNLRIYRPGIWYLNPYLDDSNPTSISQGNPNLDSEKGHAFDLSYSNFTTKVNFNVALRYSFTNNSIESVSTLVSDYDLVSQGLLNPTGKEVLYTTYQNLGKIRSASMSAYFNWSLTTSTRVYTNLFGTYNYMEGADGRKNDGWTFFGFGGAQQTFPHDWRISLNVFGQTPYVMLQGKGMSFFDYSMSLQKSFLNKRLTLSVYASDFFKKFKTNRSTLQDTNFLSESWSKYNRQRFGISVSYRIGELRASVKKAARSISNDDVKGGGGSGGGAQ